MNKNNVDSSHNFNPFLPFYSATYTRKYLTRQYKQSEIPQPKTNSYRTTYAFIYELQHGELYIKEAEKAPLQLKPVLLFYGLVKLIKSCVRTVDPHYPKTSAV